MKNKKFKKGDRVKCLIYGEGIVEGIDKNRFYQVVVSFDNGRKISYLVDGKYTEDSNQCLFHLEDFPKFNQERVVLVRDNEYDRWKKRVLIKEIKGESNPFVTWFNVETLEEAKVQYYTEFWKYMKELDKEAEKITLSISEIEEKLNLEKSTLRIKGDDNL